MEVLWKRNSLVAEEIRRRSSAKNVTKRLHRTKDWGTINSTTRENTRSSVIYVEKGLQRQVTTRSIWGRTKAWDLHVTIVVKYLKPSRDGSTICRNILENTDLCVIYVVKVSMIKESTWNTWPLTTDNRPMKLLNRKPVCSLNSGWNVCNLVLLLLWISRTCIQKDAGELWTFQVYLAELILYYYYYYYFKMASTESEVK